MGRPAGFRRRVNAGAFFPYLGAALSSVIESNLVTLTNLTGPGSLTIAGGSYSKNGGAYATAATTVANGDTLKVRLTSSASYSAMVSATVTIDGSQRIFSVTTAAASAPGGDAAFTVTQLTPLTPYQRITLTGGGQNLGAGTIRHQVNVTALGSPTFRTRASNGTILQAATALPAFAALGAQTLSITGVDAQLTRFYVDLSADGGATWKLGTSLVSMGRIIGASGQSLMVRGIGRMDNQTDTNASLSVVPSPNSTVYATYIDGQRTVSTPVAAVPADGTNYDSTFAAEFLRLQVAASGVHCSLIGHASGGQPISVFLPGGSENPALRARLDEIGGFEDFIWIQGQSDTGSAQGVYAAKLTTLFNDLAAHNVARGSNFGKYICTIPNTNSQGYGTVQALNIIRGDAVSWCAANDGTYIDARDIDLVNDGIHQSQLGNIPFARHFHRAMRPTLGLVGSDLGPVFGTPTRASGSPSIVIPVIQQSGGTALVAVGSPDRRFRVTTTADPSTALALDATTPIALTANSITLKLAAVPAGALSVIFAGNPDYSNAGGADMIYDNRTDGDGLTVGRQIAGNLGMLSVAAPAGGTVTVGPNLTPTGTATYAAGRTGFGQELTGGAYGTAVASNGSDVIPATNTWTAEFVMSLAANPSALQIMFFIANKGWVGVAPDGKLVVNYYSSAGADAYIGGSSSASGGTNPLVTGGARHHIAVAASPGGVSLLVDGILANTNNTAPANGGGLAAFTLGAYGGGAYQFTGTLDEFASWSTTKYAANFTVPSAPYVGSETGLKALYHLDGNMNAATYTS